MVLNTRRNRERERLLAEVRLSRQRFGAILARDYAPVARRLQDAYNDALPQLRAERDALLQGLGQNNPAVNRLVQRFQLGVTQAIEPVEPILQNGAAALQRSGAANGYRLGITNLQSGGMSVRFSQPTLETIIAGMDYVDSPAFREAVGRLSIYHGETIANNVLTAIAQGDNPRRVGRLISRYFEGSRLPLVDADNLARTTQIYSMRRGSHSIYERSGIEQWVWSCSLDDRACMMCISQHGTVHPISEELRDHHRGRCAACAITPRWSEFGLVGEELEIETGVEWFSRQDADTQRRIMGVQLFDAWQQNRFVFSPDVITGQYENAIWGVMLRRKTNLEILG